MHTHTHTAHTYGDIRKHRHPHRVRILLIYNVHVSLHESFFLSTRHRVIARELLSEVVDERTRRVLGFAGPRFFLITRSEGISLRQTEYEQLTAGHSVFSQIANFAKTVPQAVDDDGADSSHSSDASIVELEDPIAVDIDEEVVYEEVRSDDDFDRRYSG